MSDKKKPPLSTPRVQAFRQRQRASKPMPPEGYLTRRQAAEYLGVSRQRLYTLITEARLEEERFHQVGWCVTRASVEEFAQERQAMQKQRPHTPDSQDAS